MVIVFAAVKAAETRVGAAPSVETVDVPSTRALDAGESSRMLVDAPSLKVIVVVVPSSA